MKQKQKRFYKRILAIVTCILMLCSMALSTLALDTNPSDLFDTSNLLEPTKSTANSLLANQQSPIICSDLAILCDGEQVSDIILPIDETHELSLTSNGKSISDIAWQILIDPEQNQWANIQDANGYTLRLSYALIMSALTNNLAELRVSAKDEEGQLLVSEPLLVKVTDSLNALTSLQKSNRLMAPNAVDPAADAPSDYITITIHYLSADEPSRQIYAPYTASVLVESSHSQTVLSPTMIGFAPYYSGSKGKPVPTENSSITVTLDDQTRTYTYTSGKYINTATSLEENNIDWLNEIEKQNIENLANTDASSIYVSYSYGENVVEDVDFYVYYKSIDVPYGVRYYFQNINDDEYTQNAAISFTGMAKTGTIVGDDTLEQPVYDYYGVEPGEDFGFSALYHYPESVAADGSTMFDYYFDRNYYIIKFDNNGGYGVEPIYARYDASFVVTPPIRPGYVFQGWDEITTYEFDVFSIVNGVETQIGTQTLTADQYVDLGSPSAYTSNYTAPNGTVYSNATHRFVTSYGDGTADEATSSSHTFNGNINSRTIAYKALWAVTNTTATIVFWRENANDTKFSYWGSHSVNVQSNTTINGEDYISYLSSSVTTNDTQYFTYLTADKDVLVEGDGSTVVNVYYSRNRYTVLFKGGINGKCALVDDENENGHSHSVEQGCYAFPLCDQHTHTAECYKCKKEQIFHTEKCCSLPVHEKHTDACLIKCKKTAHTHDDTCYNCGFPAGYQHTHDETCCAKDEHVHIDSCCAITAHIHNENCCDKLVHIHNGTDCNYLTCTKHVHSLSCYTNQNLSTNSGNISTYASQIQNPENGKIYRYRNGNYATYATYYNFFYYDNTWYYIDTTSGNTTGSIGGISFTGTLSNPGSNKGVTSVTATKKCGEADHTHTASCYSCGKMETPHVVTCYTNQSLSTNNLDYTDEIENPVNGTIYRYHYYKWRLVGSDDNVYYNYFYINDQWYYINNSSTNTTGSIGGISFNGTLTVPDNNAYTSVVATTNCTTHHQHNSSCCTITAHTHNDGTCNLNNCPTGGVEHKHGEGNCVYTKCGLEAHTHKDGKCVYTKCKKEEHTHTSKCLTCELEEHTHSEACQYACGHIAHTHHYGGADSCCNVPEHTHSASCYTVAGQFKRNGGTEYAISVNTTTSYPSLNNMASMKVNGVTLYYDNSNGSEKNLCVKLGSNYYRIYYTRNGGTNYITANNSGTNGSYFSSISVTKKCSYDEHTHGDGKCVYTCGLTEHTHTDFCYGCGMIIHTHEDGNCNANTCQDQTHHVHTSDCLQCEYTEEHVHTADCAKVLICTKPEHTHTSSCNNNSTNNYHYGFVAKYEQDISALWPIYEDYTTTKNDLISTSTTSRYASFTYSCDDGGGGSFASRRVTMTADMCDTKDGVAIATFQSTNSSTLYDFTYYFESFNQTDTGVATHVKYGNTWYDKSETYSQSLYGTSSLSAKEITGMTTAGTSGRNLYYTRNTYTLELCNYDNSVISGQTYSVKFEQPISSVIDVQNYIPPYPSTLEENAYEFAGWYTTEGRFEGSEFDPNMTMPAGPVALYAKWVPLTHHVRFFETYDDMLAYEASVAAGTPDESLVYVKPSAPDVNYSIETSHGSYIGSIPNPDKLRVTNPGGSTTEYDFGGWFFVQNGSKKAYTPLDMPITRDMNIFADWGSHSAQPYVVHYALDEAETDTSFLTLLPRPTGTYADLTQTVTVGSDTRTFVCLQDGEDEYHWHRVIANDTMGYAYQGTTRTFSAKAGAPFNQLYVGFNSMFFPTVSSHSITIAFEESSVDPRINTYTFRYVEVPSVSYKVKYINSDTGVALSEAKTVNTTSAVVTERFKVFSGFVPDAFYKQLVLAVAPDSEHPGQWTSSPDNIITFYYSENTSSARYTVHFMLQKNDESSRTLTDDDYTVTFDEDGSYTFSNKFEESGSRIDGVSDILVSTPINPIEFAGFDLISNKAIEVRGQQEAGTWQYRTPSYSSGSYTIEPVEYGTDLFLFYQREEYSYKVYYLLYGTPSTSSDLEGYTTVAADTSSPKHVLADTTSGKALYGSSYSATALDIPGYTCVTNKTMTKDITPVNTNNHIIFFYTPLQYTAQYKVWKNGGGTVSNGNETFFDSSSLSGSTATASEGYTFGGWYVDENCTIPANFNEETNPNGLATTYTDSSKTTVDANGAFVLPSIPLLTPNGTEGFTGNIFYAKFIPQFGDLTIRRENGDSQDQGDQVFVYEVKNDQTEEIITVTITGNGELTIKDIPCGTYTVTQVGSWAHRFSDSAKTATVTATTPGLAVFDSTQANDKWLSGNSSVVKNVKG